MRFFAPSFQKTTTRLSLLSPCPPSRAVCCVFLEFSFSPRVTSLSGPQATLGVGHKMEAGFFESRVWILEMGSPLLVDRSSGCFFFSGATRVQGYYINNPQVKK